MLNTENSVTYQFIGNVTKGAGALPNDILDLAEGAVALVDQNNDVADGPADGTRVRVVQKINGRFVYSPFFTVGDANIQRMNFLAEVPQIAYLGLNHDDVGELDATAGATYTLGVILRHTAGIMNTSPVIKTVPAYNQSGTQYGLATTLLEAFNRLMNLKHRTPIIVERITDGDATEAIAVGMGATPDLHVTKGSNAVVAEDTPQVNGDPIAVGDWIAIEVGGDQVCYKVVSIVDSETFEIDQPYAGESGTISQGDWGTVDDPDVGNWGLRFTSIPVDPVSFDAVSDNYRPVDFSLSWDRVSAPDTANPDPTTVTYHQASRPGMGTFMEVAMREVYTTMNEGNPFISAYPPTKYRRAADPTNEYHTWIINATDDEYSSPTTGQKPVSKYNIYVCVDRTLADDVAFWEQLTA